MTNRDEGQVVYWSKQRAYGFIRRDGGEKDVFFHLDGMDTQGEEPRIGDRVSYEIGTDRNGKACAKQVRFVSEETPQAPAGLFKAPEEAVSGGALADWLTRDQK